MNNLKQVTLDSLAISSFGAGIAMLSSGIEGLYTGITLVVCGVLISAVKYYTRK